MKFRTLAASLLLLCALAAGGAFATVHRAASRAAAAEAAYPPAGRLVQVQGRAVHAVVSGSGPDVVLIHGANGNVRDFTFDLVKRLQERYRVTALDRPGLGWSESAGGDGTDPLVQADILRDAARQLGIVDPVVLGHSYGASVALAWALRGSEGTGALVLVGGATMPWTGRLDKWYRLTSSQFGRTALIPLVSAFASPERPDGLRSVFEPNPVPDGYGAHIGMGLILRRSSLDTNSLQVNALRDCLVEMSEDYPRLTLPVEIVHGTEDRLVPPDVHAIPLSKRIPGAVLTLLPGVGHMPHHADPEAVVAAIDRAAARAGLR